VVQAVEWAVDVVTLHARVRAVEGVCPHCGEASRQVHGRYLRRLADAALGRMKTVLALTVLSGIASDARESAGRLLSAPLEWVGATDRFRRLT
jgi:transposase